MPILTAHYYDKEQQKLLHNTYCRCHADNQMCPAL